MVEIAHHARVERLAALHRGPVALAPALPEPGAPRLNDMTSAWVVSSSRSVGPGVTIGELAAEDRADSLVRSVGSGATG